MLRAGPPTSQQGVVLAFLADQERLAFWYAQASNRRSSPVNASEPETRQPDASCLQARGPWLVHCGELHLIRGRLIRLKVEHLPGDRVCCRRTPRLVDGSKRCRPITESLRPGSDDDWLLVAGDVGELTTDIEW
ncbi:hypothetical protein ACWDZ8_45400, partial [Streptomyces sp. NPDC003233]